MIGRIVRSADFERVLKSPPRAHSAHFAVHFVASRPSAPSKGGAKALSTGLSTDKAPAKGLSVDNQVPKGCWLGAVVPKRHARRAVTRNLIKRQIRQAATQAALRDGLWVVRLRQAFDPARFIQASSEALKIDAGGELQRVLADASRRLAA